MSAYLAFYKGGGTIFDAMVRVRTLSKYSHVELVIDNYSYSSSIRDGGVRKKNILGDTPVSNEHWDVYPIDCDEKYALEVFKSIEGCKYDWVGILLSQALTFDIHSKNKYFCSEVVAKMLRLKDPHRFAPKDLNDWYFANYSGSK